MGNDCCKRAIVLTPKGEKYHNILVLCFFIDLLFLFIRIICGRNDGIFSTVLELLIFIMTFLTCHYIVAGFLVFFTLFDIFFTILFLGQRLQNKIQNVNDTFLEKKIHKIGVFIEICFLIFLIILIYVAFKSYKEFKAIAFGQIEEGYEPLNKEENIYNGINNSNNITSNTNDRKNNNGEFVPFSGQGYVVGGN